MLPYNRDQLRHDKPHRLPHHLFDNRGHRKQCQFPPREPWISLPGRRGGGLWGVAGFYQPIQTQLTSTPTILFAGCICWVGDLSLKAGQMLNFLIWHISEAKSSSRGSTDLLYFLYVLPGCVLCKESLIWWADISLLSREIQRGHICIVILDKCTPSIQFCQK